ncbi:globin [Pelomonas sp. Root1217]|uniref:group I truncated hemoglobin n=1 Tax=Pelomonas sp. Root1217 TaxID=1736430 RepID=UPI000709F648|nr:group 1 truncated hemoglobin [Pelomonas sp. Root1217]KQV48661.1 globin [Pelomonas sp. Root1217]
MARAVLACLLLSSAAAFAQTPPANDSVYQAWGGKAGIRAVMDEFVPRLLTDPRTAPFFKNTNRENLVTQLTDQLCQEAGGPCVYEGVPMKLVHQDLDIGRRDFNALVEILQQAMDAKGIPFSAQNGMLAKLAPMHREIVTTVTETQQRQ